MRVSSFGAALSFLSVLGRLLRDCFAYDFANARRAVNCYARHCRNVLELIFVHVARGCNKAVRGHVGFAQQFYRALVFKVFGVLELVAARRFFERDCDGGYFKRNALGKRVCARAGDNHVASRVKVFHVVFKLDGAVACLLGRARLIFARDVNNVESL